MYEGDFWSSGNRQLESFNFYFFLLQLERQNVGYNFVLKLWDVQLVVPKTK